MSQQDELILDLPETLLHSLKMIAAEKQMDVGEVVTVMLVRSVTEYMVAQQSEGMH